MLQHNGIPIKREQISKLEKIGRNYTEQIPAIYYNEKFWQEISLLFIGEVRWSYAINARRGMELALKLRHYLTDVLLLDDILAEKRINIRNYREHKGI